MVLMSKFRNYLLGSGRVRGDNLVIRIMAAIRHK